MAGGKPLTRFLIALSHSQELLAAFNSGDRDEVLREWNLADHDLFREGELTLDRVQEAVAAENADAGGVHVAWWIWFFGGAGVKPETWIWGLDDDDDYGQGPEGEAGGPSNPQ